MNAAFWPFTHYSLRTRPPEQVERRDRRSRLSIDTKLTIRTTGTR